MLPSSVVSRLENWKFAQARDKLRSPESGDLVTEDESELVEALAATFGDVGWGIEGFMATIVGAAVNTLVPAEPDEPDEDA